MNGSECNHKLYLYCKAYERLNNYMERIKSFGNDLSSVFDVLELSKSVSGEQDATSCSKQYKVIPIHDIFPGCYQPRKQFNMVELQSLVDSIRMQGILQPILVRSKNEQGYEIIAGERRWRAAQMAGLTEIPTLICELTDHEVLACGLIENLQRQDLNPIEEANAYLRLQKEFNQTHLEISKLIGKSRSAVTNTMRLLFLSPYVKLLLQEKKLTVGQAKPLLKLSYEEQEELANKIVSSKMSARDSENVVRSNNDKKTNSENSFLPNNYWARILTSYFDSHVKVQLNQHGKGKIIIETDSIHDFWVLLQKNNG